jgi:hypothetical protein
LTPPAIPPPPVSPPPAAPPPEPPTCPPSPRHPVSDPPSFPSPRPPSPPHPPQGRPLDHLTPSEAAHAPSQESLQQASWPRDETVRAAAAVVAATALLAACLHWQRRRRQRPTIRKDLKATGRRWRRFEDDDEADSLPPEVELAREASPSGSAQSVTESQPPDERVD